MRVSPMRSSGHDSDQTRPIVCMAVTSSTSAPMECSCLAQMRPSACKRDNCKDGTLQTSPLRLCAGGVRTCFTNVTGYSSSSASAIHSICLRSHVHRQAEWSTSAVSASGLARARTDRGPCRIRYSTPYCCAPTSAVLSSV